MGMLDVNACVFFVFVFLLPLVHKCAVLQVASLHNTHDAGRKRTEKHDKLNRE